MIHGVPSYFSQRIKGKNAKANHCEIDYFGRSKDNHSNSTAVQQCRATVVSYLDSGGSEYVYKISTRA